MFSTELALEALERARTRHRIAVAVRIERFQTNVNANLPAAVRMKQRHLVRLDAKGNKVCSRSCAADCGIQDPAFKSPALLDFHKADLRQLDPVAFDADAVSLIARPIGLTATML